MTKFSVTAANGAITTYEGDYKITDGAMLSVEPVDGNPILYSPAGWYSLEILDAPGPRNVVKM